MDVRLLIILGLLTKVFGQAEDQEEDEQPLPSINIYSPAFLIDLKSTDLTYKLLSKSPFTYIVVDPDLVLLSSDEVVQLRKEGRIILAYLSVGQAEKSRHYWREDWVPGSFPQFIQENTSTKSSTRLRTRFWMPEWQSILRRYLQDLVSYGYSGVVLDSVDIYQSFLQQEERLFPADDMTTLVSGLRQQQRDFLLFATNAVELYQDELYRRSIDGIVATSTWYQNEAHVEQQNLNFTLGFLRKARADSKTILAADFPKEPDHVCDFYIKCTTEVFRCAVFDFRLNGAGESC